MYWYRHVFLMKHAQNAQIKIHPLHAHGLIWAIDLAVYSEGPDQTAHLCQRQHFFLARLSSAYMVVIIH